MGRDTYSKCGSEHDKIPFHTIKSVRAILDISTRNRLDDSFCVLVDAVTLNLIVLARVYR
jgi:hypothetical protein